MARRVSKLASVRGVPTFLRNGNFHPLSGKSCILRERMYCFHRTYSASIGNNKGTLGMSIGMDLACNVNEPNNGQRTVESSLATNLASLVAESSDVKLNHSQKTKETLLAKDLASVLDESSEVERKKSMNWIDVKKFLQHRIKKKVKLQRYNGRFVGLVEKVIADPDTLKDAYHCIRVNSNLPLQEENCNIDFETLAEEIRCGNFDVRGNTVSFSTRGRSKETLILPKLNLKIVQEAMKIVLEVVYNPIYDKISHGGRSGRGHHTAINFIIKELPTARWWFTFNIRRKLDHCVLAKLISTMEEHIDDPKLSCLIRSMFDAHVLNVEFGGFPKGHGLPQEGMLSPVFLNIYLSNFDRDFYKLSLKFETAKPEMEIGGESQQSYLRSWFRRQLKGSEGKKNRDNSGTKIRCCRFMDEIFFAICGSRETALSFKEVIEDYLRNTLHMDVEGELEVFPCAGPQSIRLFGSLFQVKELENPTTRVVHKLVKKVSLFASQREEAWNYVTRKIGKYWLGHALKRIRESETKNLANSNVLLSQISCFRKPGMKTDHWYKLLLKIWMEDVNVKTAKSEGQVLSKLIGEPGVPVELKNSFYEFQRRAEDYIHSETVKILSLVPNHTSLNRTIFRTTAPVNVILKRLCRYGLFSSKGNPRMVPALVLQDHEQIIDWFFGIVHRWRQWYSDHHNFSELELALGNEVRNSCIRTLAVKYNVQESVIERRFDVELAKISSGREIDQETEQEIFYSSPNQKDEGLRYGLTYPGQCLLSLARIVSQSRPCNCFVTGCSETAPCIYTLHVMERQKYPFWKTGFASCIHPSLNKRRIGLCRKHVKDLYLGNISLQCIDFGSSKRQFTPSYGNGKDN